MGAMTGYGNGMLKPKKIINREETFIVLDNILKLEQLAEVVKLTR